MKFDTTTLLTILSIIITAIFGFLSIDLFKRKRNPGKLTLIKQATLGLFNNIAKNFDEISILYKAEPIKENVIYLKASFINDGDIDIDGNNIEKTITLNLQDNLKWIKSKVTLTSPELICDTSTSNCKKDLQFNFGLIRKKEFFQFEALIETENSSIKADDIYDKISISHRIANTQKVKSTTLLSEEQIIRKKKRIKSMGIMFGIQAFILIVALFVQFIYIKESPVYYKSNDNISYTIKAKSTNEIILKNIENSKKETISLSEFQNINNYKPYIPDLNAWEKLEEARFALPLIILLLLIIFGGEYYELRKSNKYHNIFKEN